METNSGAEQKKKKGFFAWLSNLARGGSRPAGISSGASRSVSSVAGAARQAVSMPSVARITAGAAKSTGFLSKLVSALRLPSFLATRAGVMGLILGGVTLATGLAAMTGFINEPAKSAYNPGLFNNSYYDSLVSQAEKDKLSRGSEAGAEGGSSLDMLQRQFEGEQAASEEAQASDEKASPLSAAPVSAQAKKAAVPAMPSMPRASASAGKGFGSSGFTFGGGGGGSSSSASQKSSAGGGGLKGGGGGGGSAVSGSQRGGSAPRGAYRQAQAGKKSIGSAGTVSGKQAAASMFYDGGGTVGGEVSAVTAGAGMGGSPSGAAEGSNESATDSVTAPEVPQAEAAGGGGGGSGDTGTEAPLTEDKGAPWKNLAVAAVTAMIIGAILVAAIALLGIFGKGQPWVLWLKAILCGFALALAAVIVGIGLRIKNEYGQQQEGLTDIGIGAALGVAAIVATFLGGKTNAAGKFALCLSAPTGAALGVGGAIGVVFGILGISNTDGIANVLAPSGDYTDLGQNSFDSAQSGTGSSTSSSTTTGTTE